jgi:hypothetical protein
MMKLKTINALKLVCAVVCCFLINACGNEPAKPAIALPKPTEALKDTADRTDTTPSPLPAITEPTAEHLLVKLFRESDESKYDTVVHYSFLEHDMFPLATFNYPTLVNKNESDNSFTIFNDSISVRINKRPFSPKAHKLGYKKHDGEEMQVLKTIDGKSFYGTDGEVPTWEISEINIVQNGQSFSFPQEEIKYYYQPNFNLADVYLTKDGRIILWMINSDGAGGYYVVWIWKNGKILKRFVEEGF